MLVMAGFATVLAFAGAQKLNTIAGVFTLYLVATGWAAVRRPTGVTGRFELFAFLAVLGVAAAGLSLGWQAVASPTGLVDGDPSSGQAAGTYFAFGGLALLAAALDLNALLRRPLSAAQRLARHLWRMCAALAIAAGSFFLGQQDEFPSAIQGSSALALPMLATLGAMVFWLLRTRFGRAFNRTGPRLAPVSAAASPKP